MVADMGFAMHLFCVIVAFSNSFDSVVALSHRSFRFRAQQDLSPIVALPQNASARRTNCGHNTLVIGHDLYTEDKNGTSHSVWEKSHEAWQKDHAVWMEENLDWEEAMNASHDLQRDNFDPESHGMNYVSYSLCSHHITNSSGIANSSGKAHKRECGLNALELGESLYEQVTTDSYYDNYVSYMCQCLNMEIVDDSYSHASMTRTETGGEGKAMVHLPENGVARIYAKADAETQLCRAIILGQDFVHDHIRCLHPWSLQETVGAVCPREY